MSNAGHIEEEAAAGALRALPPEEEAQVDEHIAQCSPCRHVLDEAEDTAHLLTLIVQPAPPPRHCKVRVMERIEREEFLQRPARRRWQTPGWTGWAVAGTLALALMPWNMYLQRQVANARMVQAMMVADPQPSRLKPQGSAAKSATGRMYMDPTTNRAVLVIENLQPPPAGKVYQVWVANEERQQPMETFKVAHRVEQVVMRASEPLTKFKWVMITMENAGGSTHPSETTVLFGDL